LAASQVVKITSKGQFTLPVEMRRDLSLDEDSYVYVTRVGHLIVMKKVDELSLSDISAILEPLAKKSGITRKMLLEEIERTRTKIVGERYSKTHADRSGRH
jgi:bifunctional DNA-binding transcriptional regulator/antitoxin component of YhaV-PrlF toxin-antitoxin module